MNGQIKKPPQSSPGEIFVHQLGQNSINCNSCTGEDGIRFSFWIGTFRVEFNKTGWGTIHIRGDENGGKKFHVRQLNIDDLYNSIKGIVEAN